jgi:hypothetical protein
MTARFYASPLCCHIASLSDCWPTTLLPSHIADLPFCLPPRQLVCQPACLPACLLPASLPASLHFRRPAYPQSICPADQLACRISGPPASLIDGMLSRQPAGLTGDRPPSSGPQSCWPASLLISLITGLPDYFPAFLLACQPAVLPSCRPARLITCQPAGLPNSWPAAIRLAYQPAGLTACCPYYLLA